MNNQKSTGSLFTLMVSSAFILTLAAVLLSAYLRLESIGLGCGDWPACFGWMPETRGSNLMPSTPAGAVHRFTATLLGVVVLVIAVLALRGRRPAGVGVTAPLLVFALTVFLSLLGYSTPSPDIPAVTLGNLGGGMAMLALLWWISQRSLAPATGNKVPANSLRPWALLGLLVITIQIALGAWTSASFAGPACTALPGCEGDWGSLASLARGFDPLARLAVDEQGQVISGSVQKTLHMAHRLGAVATFLYLTILAIRALKLGEPLRNTSIGIIVLLVIQVGLGIASVLAELPLLLVTAHNATAALLLLAVVNLNHILTPARDA